MITKELIKAEIDKVEDKYLEALYKIIKALETPAEIETAGLSAAVSIIEDIGEFNWHDFIEETYGSLADAPIERGDQGKFEIREEIA